MTVRIERRRWTTEEYHRMVAAGVLNENDNVELIEGDVVSMAAISSRHAGAVNRLTQLFARRLGEAAIVAVQNPIQLSEFSEPEPDVALLSLRDDFYGESHPRPDEVYLVVEVAETSLAFDRDVKVPLYAEAGISEVWLVNLVDEVIDVYRSPAPDGYATVKTVSAAATLSPEAFPDVSLKVGEIV